MFRFVRKNYIKYGRIPTVWTKCLCRLGAPASKTGRTGCQSKRTKNNKNRVRLCGPVEVALLPHTKTGIKKVQKGIATRDKMGLKELEVCSAGNGAKKEGVGGGACNAAGPHSSARRTGRCACAAAQKIDREGGGTANAGHGTLLLHMGAYSRGLEEEGAGRGH